MNQSSTHDTRGNANTEKLSSLNWVAWSNPSFVLRVENAVVSTLIVRGPCDNGLVPIL